MWTSNNKGVKVKDGDKVVELTEDRALSARMLVVSKARTKNIGIYEFIVVPRTFFALVGSLLYVTSKSDLMGILQSLPQDQALPDIQTEDMETSSPEQNMEVDSITPQEGYRNVAIVDGMAELQSFDNLQWIQTCKQLACHFIDELWKKYDKYDETHSVFDRYDKAEVSLKASTRKRRLTGGNAVAYHITDTTAIANLTMKQLLSHSNTKDELTTYLSHEVLRHATCGLA